MPKTIHTTLNASDLRKVARELEKEAQRIVAVQERIIQRLLDMGAENIKVTLSGHSFSGATQNSIDVTLSHKGNVIEGVLSVESEAILFLEFGAGLIGYGHPRASEFGYGPGTFPGKGNWDKQGGWWYPTNDAKLIIRTDSNGQGWGFSRGTKPLMPVLLASQLIQRNIEKVVREELGL